MAITCYIIDDEPVAIRSLTELLEKAPSLELRGASKDPLAGLEYVRSHQLDLLFLDISMEKITGLELVNMIDNRVVFTTAHEHLAHAALAFPNTIDYLVKPFTFERFAVALKKIEANFPNALASGPDKEEVSFPMKTHLGIQNIAYNRVKYIEANGYYSTVYYDEGNSAVVNMSLTTIESIFPSSIFARVHRSCIVNKKKVVRTTYDELELVGGISLKLSRHFKENLSI